MKRPGVNGERPMFGDKVTVHYTGKLLNGKKFDCSRDRKGSFCFHVGRGRLLQSSPECCSAAEFGYSECNMIIYIYIILHSE